MARNTVQSPVVTPQTRTWRQWKRGCTEMPGAPRCGAPPGESLAFALSRLARRRPASAPLTGQGRTEERRLFTSKKGPDFILRFAIFRVVRRGLIASSRVERPSAQTGGCSQPLRTAPHSFIGLFSTAFPPPQLGPIRPDTLKPLALRNSFSGDASWHGSSNAARTCHGIITPGCRCQVLPSITK